MNKENDQSNAFPPPHEEDHKKDHFPEVEQSKSNTNWIMIVVLVIVALLIIAALTGFF